MLESNKFKLSHMLLVNDFAVPPIEDKINFCIRDAMGRHFSLDNEKSWMTVSNAMQCRIPKSIVVWTKSSMGVKVSTHNVSCAKNGCTHFSMRTAGRRGSDEDMTSRYISSDNIESGAVCVERGVAGALHNENR